MDEHTFHGAMLVNAEWQIAKQQYPAAVLLAQAGVELRARDAFIGLIAQVLTPVNPVLDLLPDVSFMDRRTRDLWQELAGDKITEPKDVWKPYHEHVEFRNLIAHGNTWGDEPADGRVGGRAVRSVAAARAFVDRIDGTLVKLGLL